MTGPRTPGWYDDPGGDVERLRWWDGTAWAPLTRERMAHERAATPVPSAQPATWQAGDVLDTAVRPARPRWPWVAALVGLALIGVLVLRDSVQPLDGTGADASGPSGPATLAPLPTPELTFEPPTPTAPPSPRPVSGRIVDAAAGLSYSVLPGAWRAWDQSPFTGMNSTVGYYRVVQELTPVGGQYWANVGSGPVNTAFVKAEDLAATARTLTDALALGYYPKHTRRDVLQRTITVDGKPGFIYQFVAAFDPAASRGYDAKSEQVTVLVMRTNRLAPAVVYVSLPDTVKDSWPTVAALIASIRVLR